MNKEKQLKPTELSRFFGDLGAGKFEQQLAHALSLAALGTVAHGKVGTVTVKINLKRVSVDSRQVGITHQVVMAQPTERGKKVEDYEMQTQMYVNRGGDMSVFPETQGDLFETTAKSAEKEH